jgi:hypothetical protein
MSIYISYNSTKTCLDDIIKGLGQYIENKDIDNNYNYPDKFLIKNNDKEHITNYAEELYAYWG